MKKIKDFCRKHTKALVIGGVAVSCIVLTVVTKKRFDKYYHIVPRDQNRHVYWRPNDTRWSLEEVKKILDINSNNSESFAIFREGPPFEEYVCVALSDHVAIPE